MFLNPGDIVGESQQYQIISMLGNGGFGITYQARQYHNNQQSTDTIGRTVVLKQIKIVQADSNEVERDNNYLDRLGLEANTLRDLEHPCIPEFYASFTADNYYYIVQEYIAGNDLSQEILPGEPIEEAAAITMLQEILNILQFVHKNNIIHRDIKPANIIRRHSDGRLFLIDFGAVKEIATEHTNSSGIPLTRIIQSIGYTPPEQLSGLPTFNSDIHALGIMLLQAMTGFSINSICDPARLPFRDLNNRCRYIWEDYAPQINPKLKRIISGMIEYDHRCDRYQNTSEILKDLINIHKKSLFVFKNYRLPLNFYTRHHQKIKFIALVIVAALLSVFLLRISPIQGNSCSLDLEDNLSCGEEILDPLSKGAIRIRAADRYQQQEYSQALKYFQQSWQKERRDAESLIYLNNALLDANNINYYTISVAVPLTSDETKTIKSSSIAQDFLRGVAQAQTEVNLNLSNTNKEINNQLSQYNYLTYRRINKANNKGLKVIVADDANNKEQAKEIAEKIAEKKKILGVIGHYASRMTINTVDIYGQKDLAQISYGTTTKDLTENPKDNFFRVVYTNEEEAEALLKYIEQSDLQDKRIAIFYNPNSEYSNRFKIELETKIENLNKTNVNIVKEFDLANEKDFSATSALKQLDKLGVNICLLLPDGQVSNSLAQAIDVLKQDNGKRLMLSGNVLINSKVNQLETTQPLNLIAATFWHPTADRESKFNQSVRQLWQSNVNGGTAMAYDATLAMVEAIKRQNKPTRKGTIEQLKAEDFSVPKAVTGEIIFDAPKNGDRLNFYPTLVRLIKCRDSYQFTNLSLDDTQAYDLACRER